MMSLFPPKGAISLLTDALTYASLRLVIMRSLAIMTSHGGPEERLSVVDKSATKIVLMALVTPPESPLFSYCIGVLCHACKLHAPVVLNTEISRT